MLLATKERSPFSCASSTSIIGSVSHPAEIGLLIPGIVLGITSPRQRIDTSLVAQGNHRVDARRAACGNVARGKGHEQQEPGDTNEGEWISGSNSEEKAGHEASEHKGCRSADCYSQQGELGA